MLKNSLIRLCLRIKGLFSNKNKSSDKSTEQEEDYIVGESFEPLKKEEKTTNPEEEDKTKRLKVVKIKSIRYLSEPIRKDLTDAQEESLITGKATSIISKDYLIELKPHNKTSHVYGYKCMACGKNLSEGYDDYVCKYCGYVFCVNHRTPEKHRCKGKPKNPHQQPTPESLKYI